MKNSRYPTSSAAKGNEFSRRTLLKLVGMGTAFTGLPLNAIEEALVDPVNPLFRTDKQNTHDLSLSDWGPYSKKYFGISHITDAKRGISFDLSLFPWVDSTQSHLPSVLAPVAVHPWEASSDINFYSFREEIIWKNQVYCDLSFFSRDDLNRVIRLEFVNNTTTPQRIQIQSLAQLNYPPLQQYTAEPIRLTAISLPPSGVWVDALDYVELQYKRPRPTDNAVQDGRWRAEERHHDTVGGSVIGQHFGRDVGDVVLYKVSLPRAFSNAVMIWRFRAPKGDAAAFRISGAAAQDVSFVGTDDFTTVTVPIGALPAGAAEFNLISTASGSPALNGFAIVESSEAGQIAFTPSPWKRDPKVDTTSVPGATILSYFDTSTLYGFTLSEPLLNPRKLTWTELDDVFGKSDNRIRQRREGEKVINHTNGDPNCIFVNNASKEITIPAGSSHILYGLVSTGSIDQVTASLRSFDPKSPANDALYAAARGKAYHPIHAPAGEPHALGHQLLSSVLLTSLVFPEYCQRQYIRHNSPGRNWDSLYTWDSGFQGLGLLELDPKRAADILSVYTTPPGSQSAFILHGTPLPVQIFLFFELWNRTQDRDLLQYFYPRVTRFYQFLAGRPGTSSTCRRHSDHLICTWDYWLSTGGWDDYAPQLYVQENKLQPTTTPVVSSAYLIRCAKLLRMAASALGRPQDFAGYDDDIATLRDSLQKYSWDEESGYFGYVTHDKEGKPAGILRHSTGVNFNMGLDGTAPLNSGICTPAQETALLERIFSPKHLWTDIGITTISQSAPYYNPDGYWNGNVWMAHQWFLWKTMLDLGHGELAVRIAQTGLDTWKKSVDATYNCYEHFPVKTGLGDGWMQFASLSSPILSWFGAHYIPGRLTCGFEVWLDQCAFSRSNRHLTARIQTPGREPGGNFSVLACLAPGTTYRVTWNGQPVTPKILSDGLLQIDLAYRTGAGNLLIEGG